MRLDHAGIAATRDQRLVGSQLLDPVQPGPLFTWMVNALNTDAVMGEPAAKYLRRLESEGRPALVCGNPKERRFRRRNGLGCHFSIVLEAAPKGSRVLSYSFQVDADACSPGYIRYDFTATPGTDSVSHPWCHVTVGNRNLRAPAAPMTPRELVSWFLSLEPW